MRTYFTLCCLFGCFLLSAHNSNEINYVVEKNKNDWHLTIHFTPQTAILLLEYLEPQLKDQAVLKLANYYTDFTAYFNQTIDIKLDRQKVELVFLNAQLNHHDAKMEFQLLHAPNTFENYSITLNSFTEVFKRFSNYVRVVTPNSIYTCKLGKEARICTSQLQATAPYTSNTLLILTLFLGLIGGSFWFVYFSNKQLGGNSKFVFKKN